MGEAHSTLHATFASGLTKNLAWRNWQLNQLWWLVEENTDRIVSALKADLTRHPMESMAADVMALKKISSSTSKTSKS
jgi:aldehyde dehydrogenase (NAD+)